MQLTFWQQCSNEEQKSLLMRPAIRSGEQITNSVKEIINQVTLHGDQALYRYNQQFDHTVTETLQISEEKINVAGVKINTELKQAMQTAADNIKAFHQAQLLKPVQVETSPGVFCWQTTRPIDVVGLYIPGGSAPLFSTVLMLALPAAIANCRQIVLCSPPPIADEILYAAKLCGVTQIFQVGGAQAIAAMAMGTESIPKVDKIFGPGNAYVTEAKRQVTQLIGQVAIDMPAGPSEVLVIADQYANPAFIAADLLSQAEHGPDSQVILVTCDEIVANAVIEQLEQQLSDLPRADIARQAMLASRIIVAKDIEQCVEISNRYGPEHLILQIKQAETWLDKIRHAGSVFLGEWAPESVGDYASGTNHVLPTYGYSAMYSCLGLADFQKRMTVQQLTAQGLSKLASTVEIMAEAEQLIAHKRAVSIRLAALNKRGKK